jgi:hypothetical protein
MSLIVAKKIENEIFLISDTKFTYKEPVTNLEKRYSKVDEYLGGLKTILLAPGMCVAYAGEVLYAKEAFESLLTQKINIFNKKSVIDYFLQHHNRSKGLTDFLVISNTGVLELFKIQDSNVGQSDFAWIGDREAFKYLQGVLLGDITDFEGEQGRGEFEIISLGDTSTQIVTNEISKYMDAFRKLLNSDIQSVDGIRTLTRFDLTQSYYSEYVLMNGKLQKALKGNGLYFGDAPEGSVAKHVALLSSVGIGIFPVYYYTGKFGVVYTPLEKFQPEIFENIEFSDFRKKVEQMLQKFHQKILNYQASFP